LLPQGFTRLLVPAAQAAAQPLPLLGYTAVGIDKGQLMVAAHHTDAHEDWHPQHYNTASLASLIEQRLLKQPQNSILQQLAYCAREYGCFTAQNIFYSRYEGGIPVSPVCNANCIGCISQQSAECCPSPQRRIVASPTAQEIAEIAIPHLEHSKKAIISFGQGCEGEPTLEYDLLCKAIKIIRSATKKGLININTNAGQPKAVAALLEAGLDSLRVSLFSPLNEEYSAYHRPQGFGLVEVKQSLQIAAEAGKPAAINLLTYPGFSDDERRLQALTDLLAESNTSQLQLRNLNIDPAMMRRFLTESWGIGIRNFINRLLISLPTLVIGSYSKAKTEE
ncbi:MAG: radical SAM protein, partial [Firmicutes bacterium]|nr:radical SAM protein [Bacillota bacterium]